MNSANGATFLICYFRQELYIASRKILYFQYLKLCSQGKHMLSMNVENRIST